MLRKGLAVAVILLFIGLAFAPSINANTNRIPILRNTQNVATSKDTTKLTCSFYTLNGIKEVEKVVSIDDAEYLSQLMDDTDYDAIASELNRLGLLPKGMSFQETKDLISGEYGRRQFKQNIRKSTDDSVKDTSTLIKRNILCKVSGDAPDHYYFTPWQIALYGSGWFALFLEIFFIRFSWYPTFLIPIVPLELGIFGIYAFLASIFAQVYPFLRINPFRTAPCVLALIYDGPWDNPANLRAEGLLGNWTLQRYNIGLLMVGFLGLWISELDNQNEPNCKFMGFSLYTAGKDMDND